MPTLQGMSCSEKKKKKKKTYGMRENISNDVTANIQNI